MVFKILVIVEIRKVLISSSYNNLRELDTESSLNKVIVESSTLFEKCLLSKRNSQHPCLLKKASM